MKKFLFSFVIFSVIQNSALACSFAPGYFEFEPDLEGFESEMDGEFIALLPAPVVTVDKIIRGAASAGSSCEDAGMIYLTIEWPKESVYKLNDVGFYFQADNGLEPDLIFPLAPVKGEIEGNKSKFYFVWLDGHPKHQKSLNFTVNIFAVNKGLEIGVPATVKIEAE